MTAMSVRHVLYIVYLLIPLYICIYPKPKDTSKTTELVMALLKKLFIAVFELHQRNAELVLRVQVKGSHIALVDLLLQLATLVTECHRFMNINLYYLFIDTTKKVDK